MTATGNGTTEAVACTGLAYALGGLGLTVHEGEVFGPLGPVRVRCPRTPP